MRQIIEWRHFSEYEKKYKEDGSRDWRAENDVNIRSRDGHIVTVGMDDGRWTSCSLDMNFDFEDWPHWAEVQTEDDLIREDPDAFGYTCCLGCDSVCDLEARRTCVTLTEEMEHRKKEEG